jgi:DNA-binding MarR family transcriptional regulator
VISFEHHRHLGGYFHAISNALSQRMQQSCEALGLTSTQSVFLHHIWYREHILQQPTHAKDLESFFEIKHSTVSGVLQRMEAAGFLTLQASDTDRRCKTIHLTELAEATHAKAEQHIQEIEDLLLQGMTETDVAEFRRLLKLVSGNLGIFCRHPAVYPPKEDINP